MVLNKSDYNKDMMSRFHYNSKFSEVNVPKTKDILNLMLSQEREIVVRKDIFACFVLLESCKKDS